MEFGAPATSVATRRDGRTALTERCGELCERRLVELNHRVANTLQIVSSLLQAHGTRLAAAEPAAREALAAAAARVQAAALLHRHLCNGSDGGRQQVDLGRFIAEIAPTIERAIGVSCQLDVEPVEVSGDAALHLAIAANELVLNARKHAYSGRDGGVVRIACHRGPDRRLCLSVADRGRGLPSGFDPGHSTGLGMGIVRSAVRQFGGELRAESDDRGGACFTLVLALP